MTMTTRTTTLAAVGIAAATFATGPAMTGGLSQDTASFAFDGSNEIAATEQVAKLSDNEMANTEGEFIGGGALIAASIGAIGGVAAYGASVAVNDNRSWNTGSAVAAGVGGAAAGGAYGAVAGASAIGTAYGATTAVGGAAIESEINERW
jgi:hypothetical protein